jgi:hypothetical protein
MAKRLKPVPRWRISLLKGTPAELLGYVFAPPRADRYRNLRGVNLSYRDLRGAALSAAAVLDAWRRCRCPVGKTPGRQR